MRAARFAVSAALTAGVAVSLAGVAPVLATPASAAPARRPTSLTPADSVRITRYAGELLRIRTCESSGNYGINTGNGYYGAYQFAAATWRNLGYPGLPNQAPPRVQDAAAAKLLSQSGTRSWGVCG